MSISCKHNRHVACERSWSIYCHGSETCPEKRLVRIGYFNYRTYIYIHMECRCVLVKLHPLTVYEPLARYVKFRVAHGPRMPGTFSPPPRINDPEMHHGACVTHVPCCMPGSLPSGFLWSRWRGYRSRHSRRMLNPRSYVSGKRPIGLFFGSALLCWMPLVVSLVSPIVSCSMINRLILGCLRVVTIGVYFKQHFYTRNFTFCNQSPPRMFCPWTFFKNTGFNMVPSAPLCHI